MRWSGLRRVLLQTQICSGSVSGFRSRFRSGSVSRFRSESVSGFCSAAPPSDRSLYEFRVYDVQPHLYSSFLQLTNQKIHLRTAHSQLLGYWSVEYGGLNQVFHIWRYDSYSARAAVRSSLAVDPDWLQQYVSKAIPMLSKQTNEVAQLLPWRPLLAPPQEGGVVELQRLRMRGRGQWECGLKDYVQSQDAPGQVLGAFSNNIGENHIVQVLWWFQSPDHWAETKGQLETARESLENLDSFSNKLLFPLPFSPLK